MGAERGCLENDKQEDNPMLANENTSHLSVPISGAMGVVFSDIGTSPLYTLEGASAGIPIVIAIVRLGTPVEI
jgi:K+ transporter